MPDPTRLLTADRLLQNARPTRPAAKRVADAALLRLWILALEMRYRLAVWLTGCRPMPLDPRIDNSVCHVCVRERNGTRTVVKFPRFDNWFARQFVNELRAQGGVERFRLLLASVGSDRTLGPHLPRVYRVDGFGGTESEYVEGVNLAELKAHILEHRAPPPGVDTATVRLAIEQLRADLRAYWAGGGTRHGDWDLQNLIYEASSGLIKNVDHGGFVNYRDGDLQSSPEFVGLLLDGMDDILELAGSDAADDRMALEALAAVWSTTHSGEQYSGGRYISGYHSLTIRGRTFRGQRDCAERLAAVPFDFTGKVVLDLGCNTGGMLHALAGVVREGVGVDRDALCISAATLVAKSNGAGNLHFHAFDLEHDDLAALRELAGGHKVDICFMLSIAMWIGNWKDVVRFASVTADVLLFESNGTKSERTEQLEQLRSCFSDIRLLQDHSPDDPLQRNRALYLCGSPKN